MLGLKLSWLLAIAFALLLLRLRRVGILTWCVGWWIAIYTLLKFAFVVPPPASVRMLYLTIVTGALMAYASSSRARWDEFTGPILRLVLEPRRRLALVLVVLLIPAGVAWGVWRGMNVPLEAPQFGRTVHPAPPDEITVGDVTVDLVAGHNPYRELETRDPEAFAEHVENGRKIYYQNCFYCHGDSMAGDGMYAHALNPIPSNFTDPGVLPMFQETFIFWRISKGGPGLPEEGGPWDTAMPAWEQFLTPDEIWDVVLFLYDFTGYRPRAQEVHE